MSKKFFAVLLASVALPLAAHAQDAPAPADTQDPAMMQQAPAGGAATGEASEALPGAGAGDARGGVTDVPTTDEAAGAATDPATGTADTAGSATDPAAPTADTADTMATDPAASTADTSTMTGDSGQQTAGMASEGPFVTVPETGAWRVSDLEGTAVYGADGESIGDIGDVLVDQQGRVAAVIIGVGGFLGIGEKDVAVSMEALQFQPGELAAQAGTGAMTEGVAPGQDMAAGQGMAAGEGTVTGTAPAVGETGSTAVRDPIADPLTGGTPEATGDAARDVQVGPDGMPDRIVLNVTKEQLEDAPEFRGIGAAVQQQP